MKSSKHLNRHRFSFLKSLKTKINLLAFCFLFVTVLVSLFFITKGSTPHISELAYIEHSILGEDAGSMIPASCSSIPPTSHFSGDCVTTCPAGIGTFDPYFDLTGTACPAPSVSMGISPLTSVSYGGQYNSVSLSSSGATACYLHYKWASGSWTNAGSVPVNNNWGAYGPLYESLSYTTICSNGAVASTWSNVVTVNVLPGGYLTLSAPSCQIPIGASSCSVNATWETYNPAGTSAITTDPSVTLYNGNNGGPSPVSSTGVGPRTFYLYNGGTMVDQETLTATCADSGSYVGGVCVGAAADPVPTVTVSWLTNPITVGGTSNIVISSTGATACYGTAGSIWVGDLGGTATDPSGVSSPVMSTAGNFPQGVYCAGPGGTSPTVTATLTVNPAAPPGSCTGSVSWNNCTYPVSGLASGSSISSSNTNSGYTGSATLSCSNGALSGSNYSCNPVSATGVCGPASMSNGGAPTATIPTGAAACTSGAYNSPDSSGSTGYWWWNCGTQLCAGAIDNTPPPPPPPVYTCNVPTDIYYTSTILPCAGICSNGSLVYPSCPQPTKPDLVGGVVSITGHPTYTLGGSTQVIDIFSGETLALNGNIRNQGLNSTGGSFNNYIELTTITYGDIYMPGVYSYSRVGSAINTPALADATSRVVSTTGTLTLTPSMDLTAPGWPAPGSKLYYLRTCADRNSPTDTLGVIDEVFEANNCQSGLTFLNVIAPPTGTLTSSVPSCTISTAASSCTTDLTWTTSGTVGTVEVTSNNSSATNPIFTGTNGGPSTTSITGTGPTTFYLYSSTIELANTTVTTSCEGTGDWDTVSGSCRDPQVVSATITGLYYPPGTLSLTCSGSNAYSITRDGVPFVAVTPYVGPVTLQNALLVGGNYVIRCMYGSVSDQVSRLYDAVPPAAIVDLKIVPTTITEEDDVVITWDTQYPTNACTLSARVVCANNACTASQLLEATKLNTILNSTTTDFNDPGTSRLLQNAIKQVRPGGIDVDWRAVGKKTLNIRYTTDFTYDCNGVRSTRRVQVTKSEEQ